MIIRKLSEVEPVAWGNGLSHRFLVEDDGMGYTLTDTTVWAGTSSPLEYRKHLEACYCISGTGAVVDSDGRTHDLEPGTMYALDQNDPHHLIAAPGEDLRLICVFSPALRGDERHALDEAAFSCY
ncbi:ectoine synthase [Nonomuraea rubra]|uniref:L-ectoine synthase n=1 Tax=Nonomuraea rubra TaxID=46180 RepID=A0A7X0TZK5_9ACTN|nr:ectoine synthase [Nonomuraea rubra]MBB6549782.1 L-ectoine synthase [Nonomuraea rubra]